MEVALIVSLDEFRVLTKSIAKKENITAWKTQSGKIG